MDTFGSYSSFEESDEYKLIRQFLREKENLIRLQTAADLKRPSVEAVQFALRDKFGELICGAGARQKNIRRWIGRIIRQIMEENGYSLSPASGIRLLDRPDNIFKTGARYEQIRATKGKGK